MITKIKIPEIPESEITPVIRLLLETIHQMSEKIKFLIMENQKLRDEISRLKGNPPKPKIKPSKLSEDLTKRNRKKRRKKALSKKKDIKIDEDVILEPEDVPVDSKFIDYKDYFVQDIIIKTHFTRYRRARYRTPDGKIIIGKLPKHIKGHYGNGLKSYITNLNYGLNVTQPKIYENLIDLGINISDSTINDILIKDKDSFHEEKELLLENALKTFPYLQTDDTGARHSGKNGYCNHIGNDLFAYFTSTNSKNRINFLEILRGKNKDYLLNMDALDYMKENKLPASLLNRLERSCNKGRRFESIEKWEDFLKIVGINIQKNIKIVTEGALVASILSHGFNKDIVIISDEAGQFNVFLHALCWIHAERKINKLIPVNDYDKKIIDKIESQIWNFYNELKEYQKSPDNKLKIKLQNKFDEIFTQKTNCEYIDKELEGIYKIKKGLLLALDRPEIPLHNNTSENNIREYTQKRKVHGGTRSEEGRLCRDTFLSLKKTCRKLGVSFFEYLDDRIRKLDKIPLLHEIMIQKHMEKT